MEDILTQLHILALLKEGQKIRIRNGMPYLETHSTGITVSFQRWLHHDSRTTTFHYLNNMLRNAVLFVQTNKDKKLIIAIECALVGVRNLMVTYAEDANIVASLQVLHDSVHDSLHSL